MALFELIRILQGIHEDYEKCPKCGERWNARARDRSTVVRIGKEAFVCRCGDQHWTGLLEWSHLTEKQRRDYFISSLEIGVLMICLVCPPLFAYFIGNGIKSAMVALDWGAVIGFGLLAVSWAIKMLVVKISLRRCPHEVGFISGTAPWMW